MILLTVGWRNSEAVIHWDNEFLTIVKNMPNVYVNMWKRSLIKKSYIGNKTINVCNLSKCFKTVNWTFSRISRWKMFEGLGVQLGCIWSQFVHAKFPRKYDRKNVDSGSIRINGLSMRVNCWQFQAQGDKMRAFYTQRYSLFPQKQHKNVIFLLKKCMLFCSVWSPRVKWKAILRRLILTLHQNNP
jgi:hypothetical protein